MHRTPICEMLGMEHPVFQASIGGITCPELAAAVSNAGGLGAIAFAGKGYEGTAEGIQRTNGMTNRGMVANLIIDPAMSDVSEEFRAILDHPPKVVSLFWGDPAPYAGPIHEAGSLLMMTVGSAEEAKRAVDAGADIIVAQGLDAGGHVRGTTGTMSLIPAVVDAVGEVPVVAAGGIADGRGLAAALCLGAQAAWIGTRFLAAEEADINPYYLDRVLEAEASDTFHSALFDGGWPDAPGRVLRNRTVDEWEAAGRPGKAGRPGRDDVIARDGEGQPIHRYEARAMRRDMEGDIEAASLWAGQGVGLVRRRMPASEIVAEIIAEAEALLPSA